MSEQYEFKFGSSTVENKKDIKANFDLQTGSWTAEQDVTHFKEHVKDNHSRTGLLQIVSERKKLLSYLKKKDPSSFQKIIKELKLRD